MAKKFKKKAYYRWPPGVKKKPKSSRRTKQCNSCVSIRANTLFKAKSYSTEAKAHAYFNSQRAKIINAGVKELWSFLWKGFTCANKKCPDRVACDNKPTFVEAGTEEFENKAGKIRFAPYVKIAREIECQNNDVPVQTLKLGRSKPM